MPNWCNNSIEITGPLAKIQALFNEAVQDADDETGLLNHMMPMPRELQDTTAPSESGDDWYNWRVSNWGTKWEVSSEGLEFYDNRDGTATVSGWFDSAWAPPIGAYDFYLENNPDCSLTASYHEPGMDFAGFYRENEDEFFDGISAYLDNNEPDLWSPLARELDEEYGIMESIEMWREEEDA